METGQVLTPEQVAARGEKLYQEKLKAILEPENNGKFVAIEVISGEYFVGDTILGAVELSHKKFPNRLLHTIKIGYEGVYKLGRFSRPAYGWRA